MPLNKGDLFKGQCLLFELAQFLTTFVNLEFQAHVVKLVDTPP